MPITFPDILGIAGGQNFPALDATDQSVKGIAFFTSLAEAQTTAKTYQKITGFIAVITGDTPGVYQFTGADATTWENSDFWTQLAATDPNPTSAATTYTDVMALSVNPFVKHNGSGIYGIDPTVIPDEFEIIPTSTSSSGAYDVYTTNGTSVIPTLGNNTWSNTWLNVGAPFGGYANADALNSITFYGFAKLGYEHRLPGFAGFNATDQTAIENVNWTALNNASVVDFLTLIPEAVRPYVYHLHMPTDASIADELYIGYSNTTSYTDADWVDPNNWTLLTAASETTISYRVLLSSTELNLDNISTLNVNACYPAIASQGWAKHLTVSNYTADMLKELKLLVKFSGNMRTHLETLYADANSTFGKRPDDFFQFTLKTKVEA